MSHSFAYDSVDLAGANYGVTVEDSDESILSEPIIDFQQAAQSYGGYVRCSRYGSRKISLNCWIQGTSKSDLEAKLDNLKFLLDPRKGEKKLAIDWRTDRYAMAILTSPIDAPPLGATLFRFSLEFLAPDCRNYATSPVVSNLTVDSSPDTWSVTPDGTADAEAEFIVKNTSGGTINTVTLANTTRSESMTWAGTLANGSWLRVRSDEFNPGGGLVERSTDSGGSWTSVLSGLSNGFLFPKLSPRVANTIGLTGLSAGTLSLTYSARYL